MNEKFLKGFLVGMLCSLLIFTGTMAVYQAMDRGREQTGTPLAENQLSADGSSADEPPESAVTAEVMAKMALLEDYVNQYYLRGEDTKNLAEGVYKGLIESLGDPYSVYYTKEEYEAIEESTNGTYCGIGARVSQDAESRIITIVEPFEGGPAEDAGVEAGDIVYKVDGEDVSDQDLSEVVAKMKGEKDTTVGLTVLREGRTVDMEIKRREVENPTVSHKMLAGDIGYIKISEFDKVTSDQFRTALDELENQGEKGLIVDLRNNGGGRLDAVVDILDRLLPKGVIVSTKDKDGGGIKYESTNKEKFEKPMAVLMNGFSASASEVFSGAVQDYGIAKLVGTTSFGKGIVQTIFDLSDKTAIKLTTSEYFTPKGRNIHGEGLEPDIEVELAEGVRIGDPKDNQLSTALEEVQEEVRAGVQ